MIRTYLEWILTLPWDALDRGQPRPRPRARGARRRPLRPREGEGPDHRAPRRREAAQRGLRPDPLLRRAARRRQDLARPVDRARARAQVRPHVGRRRPRRGRDPRPPAHLHRLDAGHDHPLAPRRRVAQPGDPDRRDRQDGRRLPRRPGERDARGARPRAEQDLPRPLPRPAVRPLEGALHLHREHARHDPRPAARPDGHDPASPATPRTRSSGSRSATCCRSSSRRTGSSARSSSLSDTMLRHDHPRVHARGRRAEPRAAARRRLPQGGDAGREGQDAEDARRRQAAARVARAAALLGRGAQAHLGARRRDRARLHGGRRRRALHRGDRVPGQGQADRHRPARRRDAGVGAGGALVGALAHRASSGVPEDWFETHDIHIHVPGGRGAEGRPVGRRDDGDGDRLARPRTSRSPTTSA